MNERRAERRPEEAAKRGGSRRKPTAKGGSAPKKSAEGASSGPAEAKSAGQSGSGTGGAPRPAQPAEPQDRGLRRAIFLAELAEAKELRKRVAPRRTRAAELHARVLRTFRY